MKKLILITTLLSCYFFGNSQIDESKIFVDTFKYISQVDFSQTYLIVNENQSNAKITSQDDSINFKYKVTKLATDPNKIKYKLVGYENNKITNYTASLYLLDESDKWEVYCLEFENIKFLKLVAK